MKKYGILIVVVILVLAGMVGSCSDDSDNGYSKTYNTDKEYRDNVKDIADAYGISEREVDEKINAVTGGR